MTRGLTMAFACERNIPVGFGIFDVFLAVPIKSNTYGEYQFSQWRHKQALTHGHVSFFHYLLDTFYTIRSKQNQWLSREIVGCVFASFKTIDETRKKTVNCNKIE